MSRLMKRLRRRGKRISPTWRMVFYNRLGMCEIVEVVRTYRLIHKARGLIWTFLRTSRLSKSPHGKPLESASGGSTCHGTEMGFGLSQQAEKEVEDGC